MSWLLSLTGVWAAGLAAPGPDFFLIANRGAVKGRSHALAAAAGVVAGIEVWVVVSLIGMGALLREFPQARAALSVLGGAYLLYLGSRSLQAGKRGAEREEAETEAAPPDHRAEFFAGLMTNLGNPKALVFFGALFVRFVPEGSGWLGGLAAWSTMTAMACAWFGALAALVSRKSLQSWLAGRIRFAHYATGAVFAALGALMAYEGLAAG